MTDRALEDLLRPLAGQVLGVLVRRYGQFDACEDAVQEALLDASVQWPDARYFAMEVRPVMHTTVVDV